MSVADKSKSFAMLFLLFLTTVPLFMAIYFSDPSKNEIFQGLRQRRTDTSFTKRSEVIRDRVVLLKGSSVTINNCKLVYKGIENKMIYLDTYLLELDPQYAYQHIISKEDANDGFRLGDSEFQLISVKKNKLRLKIKALYKIK